MNDEQIGITEEIYPDLKNLSMFHAGWYHLPKYQENMLRRECRRIAIEEAPRATITVYESSLLKQTQFAIMLRHLDLMIVRGDQLQIWKEAWFSEVKRKDPVTGDDGATYPIVCTFGDLATYVMEENPDLMNPGSGR